MKPGPKPKPFMEWVSPEPNSGCWLWTGTANNHGYGKLQHNGKLSYAHRVSYLLHIGPISDGLCVLHKCDVPSCCNPDHLWLGTKADNTRDKVAKRRQHDGVGENNGRAKLTAKQVKEIRSKLGSGQTRASIAAEYGVKPTTVSGIQRGETWKSVLIS